MHVHNIQMWSGQYPPILLLPILINSLLFKAVSRTYYFFKARLSATTASHQLNLTFFRVSLSVKEMK